MRALLFAIGFGIALLVPLAVYTGVSIFKPGPEWEKVYAGDFQARRESAGSVKENQQITKEEQQAQKTYKAQEKEHEKVMFFVSFPIGIAAVIAGAFLRFRAVGAGLVFGGIFLLAEGCYSYWDKMTAVMRFASILVSPAVFVALGVLKSREAAGMKPATV